MSTRQKIIIISILFLLISCSDKNNILNNDEDSKNSFSEISGTINGTLSSSKSPYYVKESIIIESKDSLYIEPNVKLLFADSSMLVVNGKLNCIGDSSRPIIFTAFEEHWAGIKIINSDNQVILKFCIIEKVHLDDTDSLLNSSIEVCNSNLLIQNCIIKNNYTYYGGGLFTDKSNVIIKNNIFRDNQAVIFGGAILCLESKAVMINNTIYNNLCENHGGGLVFINSIQADVQNNIFYSNWGNTGDSRISFVSGDLSKYNQEYNFLECCKLNPEFISEDDLHLKITSICIDAGNPDPSYWDYDGTINDQGAYGGPSGNW